MSDHNEMQIQVQYIKFALYFKAIESRVMVLTIHASCTCGLQRYIKSLLWHLSTDVQSWNDTSWTIRLLQDELCPYIKCHEKSQHFISKSFVITLNDIH